MPLDRRSFLVRSAFALPAASLARSVAAARQAPRQRPVTLSWRAVRNDFALSREWVHLAGMLLASHPRPVREAIERHRRGLDRNPVHYLRDNRFECEERVLAAAARYLGGDPREVALTDSTTMGLATLYTGIRLDEGQEIVCSTHDHYATRASIAYRAERTGASSREVALYGDLASVTAAEIVERARAAIGPRTRVFGVTWVHSSTGLKLPLREIAHVIGELNATRDPEDRVLFAVDGVHGFGAEDETVAEIGCDFFVAGCHKWIHGPRGTGLVWGRESAWEATIATIPSFTGHHAPGAEMTPGGFHSFEHRWALAEAFEYHERLGRARVSERVRDLAGHVKEGLAKMAHVRVRTPMSPGLSAGMVCFEVDGVDPYAVEERLAERKVVASVAPYASRYVRITPQIFNTHADVDRALAAVRSLAAA